MTSTLTARHWDLQAQLHGTSPHASWADDFAIDLEFQTVKRYCDPGAKVLDAGCANGHVAFRVLDLGPTSIEAIDFSRQMIDEARKAQLRRDPDGIITFKHGDVRALAGPKQRFDFAYTIRTLINLSSWQDQEIALRSIHGVMKPGSIYVMSEAFDGSLAKLNAIRSLVSLPPLPQPEINCYLNESELEAFLPQCFELVEIRRFSSLYYLGSRVVRDLTQWSGNTSYHNPVNAFFSGLDCTQDELDIGVQKAYVLRAK